MNNLARRYNAAHTLLPASYEPTVEKATAYAPVNIALIKYWGKRDVALHLPLTDSFSITIDAGTTTTITRAAQDTVVLNGKGLAKDSPFYQRLVSFLDLVRPASSFFFSITTTNQIPTGAGLASSASGFAALVLALKTFFSWDLPIEKLSCLARLGSGSACRSVFDGFAHWEKGCLLDGTDSYAKKIHIMWPDLCFGVFFLSLAQKPIGSTEAMQRTVETSPLFSRWPSCVEADLAKLKKGIEERDFSLFGRALEQNALTMHATMHASWPPIVFWKPETIATLHSIMEARENGLPIYLTMDAGPNVKVFFLRKDSQAVLKQFPTLTPISLRY
jgi:diphosphomevalonate decarboxylase